MPENMPRSVYAAILKYEGLSPSTTTIGLPKALLLQWINHAFKDGWSWYGDEKQLVATAQLLGVNTASIVGAPQRPARDAKAKKPSARATTTKAPAPKKTPAKAGKSAKPAAAKRAPAAKKGARRVR